LPEHVQNLTDRLDQGLPHGRSKAPPTSAGSAGNSFELDANVPLSAASLPALPAGRDSVLTRVTDKRPGLMAAFAAATAIAALKVSAVLGQSAYDKQSLLREFERRHNVSVRDTWISIPGQQDTLTYVDELFTYHLVRGEPVKDLIDSLKILEPWFFQSFPDQIRTRWRFSLENAQRRSEGLSELDSSQETAFTLGREMYLPAPRGSDTGSRNVISLVGNTVIAQRRFEQLDAGLQDALISAWGLDAFGCVPGGGPLSVINYNQMNLGPKEIRNRITEDIAWTTSWATHDIKRIVKSLIVVEAQNNKLVPDMLDKHFSLLIAYRFLPPSYLDYFDIEKKAYSLEVQLGEITDRSDRVSMNQFYERLEQFTQQIADFKSDHPDDVFEAHAYFALAKIWHQVDTDTARVYYARAREAKFVPEHIRAEAELILD